MQIAVMCLSKGRYYNFDCSEKSGLLRQMPAVFSQKTVIIKLHSSDACSIKKAEL